MMKMGWIGLCVVAVLCAPTAAVAAPPAPGTATAAAGPAPGAPPALAAVPPSVSETRRGGWLELKYGVPLLGGGWYGGSIGGPHILGGYRFGRVTLGLELGASYSRYDDNVTNSNTSYRQMNVLAQPVVQVTFLQRRTWEVYLQAGAGVVYSLSRTASGDYRSESLGLVAHLAGGARVFLHPRFGVGLEVGVTGHYAAGENLYPSNDPQEGRSGSASLYAALGLSVRL